VMPYSCGFEGSRLVVQPGAGQSYEVIGARAQQPFTMCQPDGNRCTTTTVHKFAIDCGGVRVPWMRVVAALPVPRPQRRWIDRGRLQIVRPEDPGAAPPPCTDRQRARGDCLPWKSAPRLIRIEMPAGYAALSDARARIESVPATTAAPGAPVTIERPADVARQPAPAPTMAAPGPAVSSAPAVVVPGAPSQTLAPTQTLAASQSAGEPSTGAGSQWVAVIEAKDLSEEPEPSAQGWTSPWGLLGGLAAAFAAVAALGAWGWRLPADTRNALMVDVYRRSVRARVRLAVAARWLWEQARPAPVASLAERPAEEDQALAHAAWTAAALLDQIDGLVHSLEAGTPLREVLQDELHAISQRLMATRAAALDGAGAGKAAAQFRSLVRELERVKRIAEGAAASLSGSRQNLAMPTTKSEAYQMLGVNPDVSDGILKKLVDALRMTWHPDHARDDHDRAEREARIKQINVAWEIISEKRQAA